MYLFIYYSEYIKMPLIFDARIKSFDDFIFMGYTVVNRNKVDYY